MQSLYTIVKMASYIAAKRVEQGVTMPTDYFYFVAKLEVMPIACNCCVQELLTQVTVK